MLTLSLGLILTEEIVEKMVLEKQGVDCTI